MNEEIASSNSDTVKDQDSAPESKVESTGTYGTKKAQNLIPRKQNKMVAERTSDMYFSGLMSE
jgi:hypothetical protein